MAVQSYKSNGLAVGADARGVVALKPMLVPRSVALLHVPVQAPPRSPWHFLAPCLVALAALTLAAVCYSSFLQHQQHLWTSLVHDRNAHYWLALTFATDLGQGDLTGLLHDLHKARVWPPLYPILAGTVMALGGPDARLAVLPNVLGWAATVVLGFLLARRVCRRGGNWAGLVAACFLAASPAHRAYATDIMLESLGACLTLATLYALVVAWQEPTLKHGRWLALTLSLLFFHKYNYWLLVVIALSATLAAVHGPWICHVGLTRLRHAPWRAWLGAQIRHPLNYLLVGCGVLLGLILSGGLNELAIGDRSVVLFPPVNLATILAWLFVLRFLPWWVRQGRALTRTWPEVMRPLVGWHMIPVLVWLLWPQRLWHFLFFLSPANAGERPAQSMTEGWTSYWQFLVEDYHLALGTVIVATTLVGVAIAKVRRLRPGAIVLIVFLAVSVLATVHHPNRKSRFTHSWVGVAWVLAGAGLAELAFTRRRRTMTTLRPWLAGGAACALLATHGPMLLQAGSAPEAGVRLDRPSSGPLQKSILSNVEGARRVAVLSNQPIKFFIQWPILERFGDQIKVETDLRGMSLDQINDQALDNWLARHQFDRILFLDVGPNSPFHEIPTPPGFERSLELLIGQSSLELVECSTSVCEGYTLWVWRPR